MHARNRQLLRHTPTMPASEPNRPTPSDDEDAAPDPPQRTKLRLTITPQRDGTQTIASEDRTVDGVYRPEAGDPQVANAFASSAFELFVLAGEHVDPRVRKAAARLLTVRVKS